MVITLPVKANDILILASDGLSDNLWDEDVLDEVVRFKKTFLDTMEDSTTTTTATTLPKEEEEEDSGYSSESSTCSTLRPTTTTTTAESNSTTMTTTLKRKSLAGMLSEALCSRARHVSERSSSSLDEDEDKDEIPFGRRAREIGKRFCGGKDDDISVVVAVISPRGE